MRLRVKAAAKINWTLEAIGPRPDGFHEIKTVLQTIDLCDTLELEPAPELTLDAPSEGLPPSDENLVIRAARLLQERARCRNGARMRLTKAVAVGAGLGGGSSDAAAALRGLNALWKLGLSQEALANLAAELGSDVPFFLCGGTALAEGRGERITSLPDILRTALVIVVPPLAIPDKTRRMYSLLTAEDYSDGSASERLIEALRQGESIREEHLYNAFDRVAFQVFPELEAYRRALLEAGATAVHVAGSGPALFALIRDEEQRERLIQAATAAGARAFAASAIPAWEALSMEELID